MENNPFRPLEEIAVNRFFTLESPWFKHLFSQNSTCVLSICHLLFQISLSQKDSALRKASVGANGKEETSAEVIVHRSNSPEEFIPTPLGPLREKTIDDTDLKNSLQIHSPGNL